MNDVRVMQHLGCTGLLLLATGQETPDYDAASESLAIEVQCSRCQRVFILVLFTASSSVLMKNAPEVAEQMVAESFDERTRYLAEHLAFQAMTVLDDEERT